MFDLYGLKWPRSFEFVAVQRSVSELKVVIFAFGIVLTLLIVIFGLLQNASFKPYATFTFAYSILLLLFASWSEDHPIFARSSVYVVGSLVVITSVYQAIVGFVETGASIYTLYHGLIWLYTLAVVFMTTRALGPKSHIRSEEKTSNNVVNQ